MTKQKINPPVLTGVDVAREALIKAIGDACHDAAADNKPTKYRELLADLRREIALRSPEKVLQIEIERGLA